MADLEDEQGSRMDSQGAQGGVVAVQGRAVQAQVLVHRQHGQELQDLTHDKNKAKLELISSLNITWTGETIEIPNKRTGTSGSDARQEQG